MKKISGGVWGLLRALQTNSTKMRGEGNMCNEVLLGFFARVAEYFRRLEVEPAEKMTQIFSNPPLTKDLNEP